MQHAIRYAYNHVISYLDAFYDQKGAGVIPRCVYYVLYYFVKWTTLSGWTGQTVQLGHMDDIVQL